MRIAMFVTAALLALACAGEGAIEDAASHDTAKPDEVAADAATPDGDEDPGLQGDGTDQTGDDVPLPDATDPDTILDPDAEPDDQGGGEVFDPCTGPGAPGALPVGALCLAHADCKTGYCYDESWKDTPENAGFRFCTIGCSGCTKSCSDWASLTAAGGSCVLFLAAESNEHDLHYRSICMSKCQTDADCTGASAGALTKCRMPLHFDGSSIGLQKSCFPQ